MEGFSVLTTCFNDSKGICGYLDSINAQTVHAEEIIIVDGGSKDNTIDVVEKYKKNSTIPIRIISGKRLNIAQGFNTAIRACHTNLFIISCIGNVFERNMAELLVSEYQKTNADIVYGRLLGITTNRFSRIYNATFMGDNDGIPCCSNRCVLLHKNTIAKNGYFLENFIYAGEDAEYYLSRCKMNSTNFAYIDNIVAAWEVPNSLKEFNKKTKTYTIAELQWTNLKRLFFNAYTIYTLIIIFAFLGLTYSILVGLLSLFLAYILGLLYSCKNVKKVTIGSLNLYLYSVVLTVLFRITNIKYSSSKHRVIK